MSNYGDQFMKCPECGGRAESDTVDVGVGLYIAGNYWCECGWEITADGKANIASYDDWFPDSPIVAEQQGGGDWEATLRYCEKQWSEERGVMIDKIHAIRKVRDGYADQARFAEVEPASYFREFVRRVNSALS